MLSVKKSVITNIGIPLELGLCWEPAGTLWSQLFQGGREGEHVLDTYLAASMSLPQQTLHRSLNTGDQGQHCLSCCDHWGGSLIYLLSVQPMAEYWVWSKINHMGKAGSTGAGRNLTQLLPPQSLNHWLATPFLTLGWPFVDLSRVARRFQKILSRGGCSTDNQKDVNK